MAFRRRNNSNDSGDDEEDNRARKKRKRADNIDIEERLESLITRVCEKSSSSLESNLEGLTTVLEADMANFKPKILKILLQCVLTMPENLTVYTTLVGLINAKNYNAGGEFVDMLVRQLKESLKAEAYDIAKTVLRFLSDLVNCHVVTATSLMILYKNFISVTHEQNIPQVRSDWFVSAVLSCMPWVGGELNQKRSHEMNELFTTVRDYMNRRQKVHVPILRIWTTAERLPQEENLDRVWAVMESLRGNGWEENEIVRPYLAFDGVLCDALQHVIPPVNLPQHRQGSQYPMPSVHFSMFEQEDIPTDLPTLPQQHSLLYYLVEEYLNLFIHNFHHERKECAEALVSYPLSSKVPLNYMIVEVVFSHLFHLPRPYYLELFYGSLFIELCKLQPGSMPQVLAQATEILFEKLDNMNLCCIERFSNWFSYHLSNFQFKWSWEDWSECLDMDPEAPKPKFVRETLLKCLRLSYHIRVAEITPDSFHNLLPAKPEPRYKYEAEGEDVGSVVAHKLMQDIKAKCTILEAEADINEIPKPMDDESEINALKIDVFVQTLLYLGAKSFSHSFAAISKFHHVLKTLSEGAGDVRSAEQAQVCILQSIHDLWSTHQQMIVVLVDKLLKIQILQCSSVVAWIFSPSMSQELTNWYIWEILHSSIKKMNTQVLKIEKEIEAMQEKLDEHNRRKREGFELSSCEIQTEEVIEVEREKLDEIASSQKNLFLLIFQRFIMILTEHVTQCDAMQTDYSTPWYKWMIERLQQIFLLHHDQVHKYVPTLESLMFTSDTDSRILEVFQQFCSLRS